MVEPRVVVPHLVPACIASTTSRQAQRARKCADREGSSEAPRWISEYQPSTAGQPEPWRAHQRAQVAHLVGAVGVRRRASATISGDRSMPWRPRPPGEVRRDMAGPAADLDHRPPSACGDPVEQPALERQSASSLASCSAYTPRPRGTTPAPGRRGLATVDQHRVAVDGGRAGRRGSSTAEQVHPPGIVLAPRGAAARCTSPASGGHPAQVSSTAPRSGNACSRSVRVFSAPGGCAPRSSRTVISARSSSARRGAREGLQVLQRRRPRSAQMTRRSSRSSARAASGARLLARRSR